MAVCSIRRTLLFIGLPVLIALGAIVWWQSRSAQPSVASPEAAPVRVLLAQVESKDIPMRLQGLGTVRPWATVTVRARLDGQLESVYFTEGEIVRQDQLLARLDDRIQQAQLAQATAQKARNQSLLDNARADLQRYEQLARHSAIDRQTLDTQRATVAGLIAAVQADEAQIDHARTQLDYTRILAPLAGRTGALLIDPGNNVRSSDDKGIVVINQLDPAAVSFTVPDTAFGQIRLALQSQEGMQHPQSLPVQIIDRQDGQLLAQGDLVLIDNQIDQSSATLRLKARVPNHDFRLWPGQTVEVHLLLGLRASAVVVPAHAVQRSASGLYVYLVDENNAVHLQLVNVLLTQDGESIIATGLTPGQRVVLDGHYKLRPGMKITEVLPDDAQAALGVNP